MNKKATDENIIKNAVFALIIMIILLSIFNGIMHTLPVIAKENQCQSYVKLASRLKNPFTKQTRLDLSNSCPTTDLTIKAEGKTDEDNRLNALDDILSEMFFCAKKFGLVDGKVKYNPFSQWKTENVCIVCTNVEFDDSLKGRKLDGILSRSIESNIPTKEEKTFLEYFSGQQPTDEKKAELVAAEKENQYIIDTDQKYYIVYSVDMSTSWEGYLKRLALGAGAGALTGEIVKTPLSTALYLVTGGKLKAAKLIFWGFTAAGIAGGASLGSSVNDQSDPSLMGGATLLLVSQNPNIISSDKDAKIPPELSEYCKTLGTNPMEDPWAGKVIS